MAVANCKKGGNIIVTITDIVDYNYISSARVWKVSSLTPRTRVATRGYPNLRLE